MMNETLIRLASPADRTAMERVINAAFAVETFIEGTRTDPEHLASMMQQGIFLLAFDPSAEEFHPRHPLEPGLECHSIVTSKPL